MDFVYILFWRNLYGDSVVDIYKDEERANREMDARLAMHPHNDYAVERFLVK